MTRFPAQVATRLLLSPELSEGSCWVFGQVECGVFVGCLDGAVLTLGLAKWEELEEEGMAIQRDSQASHVGGQWSPALTLGPQEVGKTQVCQSRQSDNTGKRLQTCILAFSPSHLSFSARRKLVLLE